MDGGIPYSQNYFKPMRVRIAPLWIAIALMLNPIARGMELFSSDATGSFTNLAGRLLESELNLREDAIQVYPANQYTPGVHRILQLAANIYDSTTNRFPLTNGIEVLQAPSVFRPIFRRNPGPVATNVFIAGYREVESLDFLATFLGQPTTPDAIVDLQIATNRARILPEGTPFQDDRSELMVAGIPVVMAARKGFPNFNKFEVQNSVTVARRLDFQRLSGGWMPIFQTNQVYTLTITNCFGAQAWNSYSNEFMRPVRMIVAGEIYLSLTNEFGEIQGPDGMPLSKVVNFLSSKNIDSWPGFVTDAPTSNPSFSVPLLTNALFLPTSEYLFGSNRFISETVPEQPNFFPVPRWFLSMTIQFRYLLLDQASGRILDAVNLSSSEEPVDVMKTMAANGPCVDYLSISRMPVAGSLWCTTRFPASAGADNPFLVTYGILNQLEVSMLPFRQFDQLWANYNSTPSADVRDSIDLFDRRLVGDLLDSTDPEDIYFSAPFNPTMTFYQQIFWEANDPLVHYTVEDLTDQLYLTNTIVFFQRSPSEFPYDLTNRISDRYHPWGAIPYFGRT